MSSKHPLSSIGTFYEKQVAECCLKNGEIITFGGCVDIPNSYKDSGELYKEIYSFSEGEWLEAGHTPSKRASGSSVELIDFSEEPLILVVGGWGDGWGNTASSESFLYNVNECSSHALSEMPIKMKTPELKIIGQQSVLATEDNKKQLWSFKTKEWSIQD